MGPDGLPSRRLFKLARFAACLGTLSIVQRFVVRAGEIPFSIRWRVPNVVNDLYLALGFVGLVVITRRRWWFAAAVAIAICGLVEAASLGRLFAAAAIRDANEVGRLYLLSGEIRLACVGGAEMVMGTSLIALRRYFLPRWSIAAGSMLIVAGLLSTVLGSLFLVLQRPLALVGLAVKVGGVCELLGWGLLSLLFVAAMRTPLPGDANRAGHPDR
jgi:hypothetical protein